MQNGDSYDSNMLEDPNFQAGFNMFNRIKDLEKQLDRKQVMIEEVLERSNEEKRAHTRTREEVQSLEKAIVEERKAIEGQKKEIEKVKSQAESWKLKYNGEKDNVATARSEIVTGQDHYQRINHRRDEKCWITTERAICCLKGQDQRSAGREL